MAKIHMRGQTKRPIKKTFLIFSTMTNCWTDSPHINPYICTLPQYIPTRINSMQLFSHYDNNIINAARSPGSVYAPSCIECLWFDHLFTIPVYRLIAAKRTSLLIARAESMWQLLRYVKMISDAAAGYCKAPLAKDTQWLIISKRMLD